MVRRSRHLVAIGVVVAAALGGSMAAGAGQQGKGDNDHKAASHRSRLITVTPAAIARFKNGRLA